MDVVAPHSFLALEAAAHPELCSPRALGLAAEVQAFAEGLCWAGVLDALQDRVGRQREIKGFTMFPGKFGAEFHWFVWKRS